MNIKLNRNSETPIYLQIKSAIIKLITSQELVSGYKLPSERKLADELGVHRNTVVKAYSELTCEGYLDASRKAPKGYFVTASQDYHSFSGRFFPLEKLIQYDFHEREKIFLEIFAHSEDETQISMGGLLMGRDAYPVQQIDELASGMFHSCENEIERLKGNICKLLSDENIYISKKNIQIVSETNQAIGFLVDLFLHEGDCILAEEPIVPDNVTLFRMKRLHLVTVPMEKDGMDLIALEAMIAKHKPKFIYTMPNNHNPSGITMSLEKRLKLLEIAQRCGIPIIEEDSLREFRYMEQRIPSLFALDKQNSVIYLHSFTLTLPYGVGTGYVLGPQDLAEQIGRCIMINGYDLKNADHYLINEYIERGLFTQHTEWLAEHYHKRRDLLIQELEKIQNKGIDWDVPPGGLILWCRLADNIKERRLYQIARSKGLLLMPGFLFYPHGYQGCGHIRLAFSKCDDDEIREAVRILGEALDICIQENKTHETEKGDFL
ncbi:MAG: PLP-dependent aminotransferase family protein [Clostridia bacterium]